MRTIRHSNSFLEILEQRRLLSFSLAVSYPAGYVPRDLATADFNNDGRLDLVMANSGYGADSVSVLLGNSNGTFQSVRNSRTGVYPIDLAVGDFNEDGKLDVATANDEVPGNEGVSVLLGLGDGTFAWTVDSPISFEWSTSIVAGDLNADGHVDLVATEVFADGDTCVSVMLGHGDATFTCFMYGPYSYDLYSRILSPPALADVNGDGKVDVAVPGVVFLGSGGGALQEPDAFNTGADLWNPLADFNADGILDRAGYGSAGLSVSLGKVNGTFAPSVWTAAGNSPTSVTVGDFNGDGRPDAALTNFTTVSVLLNNGNWATKSYVGPTGGNWSTAANWSPSGVPGADDLVTIPGKSVNLPASATLASLTLTAGASLSVAANGNRVLRASTLSISADSKLDLNDNALVLNSQPASVVANHLASGYANGAWNGYGICSSLAASIPQRGIGYAQASDLFGTFTATFQGQSVNASDALIRYTLSGDANLDGQVNSVDFTSVAMNFNQSGKRWSQGDFNFDGKVNALDFNALVSEYGWSLAAGSATSAEPSSVLVSGRTFAAAPRDALFSNDRIDHIDQLEIEDSFV